MDARYELAPTFDDIAASLSVAITGDAGGASYTLFTDTSVTIVREVDLCLMLVSDIVSTDIFSDFADVLLGVWNTLYAG